MNQITSFIFPDDYSKTGVHGSTVSHPGPVQSEPAQVVGPAGRPSKAHGQNGSIIFFGIALNFLVSEIII